MPKYLVTSPYNFEDYNRKFKDGQIVELSEDDYSFFSKMAPIFKPLEVKAPPVADKKQTADA